MHESIELAKDAFFSRMEDCLVKSLFHLEKHWDVDHICFRVNSLEDYEQKKESFLKEGKLLSEVPVGGRLISSIALQAPIQWRDYQLDLLELPQPKEGRREGTGFEHIEVVIDCSFESLLEKYPHLEWKKKGLNKSFNKELQLCFGDVNIKFHHQSLASVVCFEEQPAFAVMLRHEILDKLSEFHPQVAGTLALGIGVRNSDVDILLSGNLDKIEKHLQMYFSEMEDFKLHRKIKREKDSLVASFTLDSIPFELFAQEESVFSQWAYRHFSVEEKLLKYANDPFLEEVKKARAEGLKTEPSFCKVLGEGEEDPYLYLYNLSFTPIKDLKALLTSKDFLE